jgi:hypothetical protein
MELEDPQDLRARFRKFLILTNERKQMSTKTLRKRISLTATTALFAGMLSFVATPSASAAAGDTNLTAANPQIVSTHLLVATENSTTGASIVSSATDIASAYVTARSLGLLVKDASTATAQTATVLAGGALSLYASVSTNVAFNATGGSFTGATVADKSVTGTYNQNSRSVFIDTTIGVTDGTATAVAVRWSAGTTPGTYTVSMNRSSATTQTSATEFGGTLTGQITVTVVAASAGGAYSAAYSACNTRSAAEGHGLATGVDSTGVSVNGEAAYIAFDLDDAYDQSLDPGALVVTATGGALISLAANASTAAAGTTSTVVSTVAPTNRVVQVNQGTANAPLTSTVTITYNGTTVCTKTVSIRGEIAKLVIGNLGTGDLNSANSITAGATTWMAYAVGATDRAGLFTVVAQDSAGNTVVTNAGGSFSADSATLTTTVQALSIGTTATTVSTTADYLAGHAFGTFTCGATAGSSPVKLKWTNSGSGTVVTSDVFTARCADDPYTYTASFDKASYVQGELATLTVQFLDSKGNKANNVGAHGAQADGSFPMLTRVTGASTAGVANKADGTRVYTFTVGGSTAVTAGSYTSIVEYASLVAGSKQTPSYKVSTGSTDVSNAEVLKSIVALIASINKQIQALQKLILQRR